jgi:hypothetical protein
MSAVEDDEVGVERETRSSLHSRASVDHFDCGKAV